jgi:hypothetical protein
MNAWDDGIEAEGGGKNVRIWGNYLDNTATGVATTSVAIGPLYIWRNVYNHSRQRVLRSWDTDDRNTYFKSGDDATYGRGRRYVFHNTALQPIIPGAAFPGGAGGGLQQAGDNAPMTNTVSRNNVLQTWKPNWPSFWVGANGANNDLDYDLYNGTNDAGGQANGIKGVPVYAPGSGIDMSGMYQLAPGTPGFDKGVRLPNFNDGFQGAAPDIGAHEAGTPPMKFGVNAGK